MFGQGYGFWLGVLDLIGLDEQDTLLLFDLDSVKDYGYMRMHDISFYDVPLLR